MLSLPGLTCWRAEPAARAAFLLDTSAYYAAAKAVMLKARRTIHLVGWSFDPLTHLEPGADGGGPAGDRMGDFLKALARERPDLDVRVLVWKSALPIAASQHFFPHRARRCFEGSPVRFRLDATVPFGACHHQKILVVDDRIAFCGGADFGADRWDTMRHRDQDRRRTMPWGGVHGPRHEVMALLEGPVAAALGELVRRRWARDDGEQLDPPALPDDPGSYWPERVKPELYDVEVSIARTEPAWRRREEVRESERLHLAGIAAARRLIYIENQYVTAPLYAEALAARLAEPDGPEVVIVSTARAPSWFDHLTMDRTRSTFLKTLKAADAYGRMHAYCPYTRGGENIIVHSKTTIIDDRMLRTGSTNLNNRSAGFDTECDVAVEAGADDAGATEAIRRFRARLLAHYIGCPAEAFEAAHCREGSLAGAIAALDAGPSRRLRPISARPLGVVAGLIAAFHLGDPADVADAWRPWRREAEIEAERRAFLEDLNRLSAPRADGPRSGSDAPERVEA